MLTGLIFCSNFPIFIASNYCLMFLYSQTRYHLVLAFLTFLLLLDAFLSYLKFNVECNVLVFCCVICIVCVSEAKRRNITLSMDFACVDFTEKSEI